MIIEDLAKEKRGNNPDELSKEDEKDVYTACITYWTIIMIKVDYS